MQDGKKMSIKDFADKFKHDQEKIVGYYIDEIDSYIDTKDFQYDFFSSLYDQYVRGLKLSDKQVESLKKIYERVTE